jgi:hypothetical protein
LAEGELAVKFPPGLKPRLDGEPPGVRAFVRENVEGAQRQPLPLTAATLDNPEHEDWWVWRPEKPQANHVYSMQFTWKPSLVSRKP